MAIDAIEMSVPDWINVPDNPRQRNTEKRAGAARLGHLREYFPIHRFVYAATINGNIACKLDGHTRSLLWKTGDLGHPPNGKVVVLLVAVKSIGEAKQVYDQLDSPPSVKKPSDRIFGATREYGFSLTSPLLRSCSFSTQLKVAETGARFSGDVIQLVKKWKPELIALDGLGLSSNYTILIAPMLVAIRRDGVESAGRFFAALDRNEGTKQAQRMDAVQLLHQHIETRRAEGSTAGYDNLIDIIRRTWCAYIAYKDGKMFHSNTRGFQPIDFPCASTVVNGKTAKV